MSLRPAPPRAALRPCRCPNPRSGLSSRVRRCDICRRPFPAPCNLEAHAVCGTSSGPHAVSTPQDGSAERPAAGRKWSLNSASRRLGNATRSRNGRFPQNFPGPCGVIFLVSCPAAPFVVLGIFARRSECLGYHLRIRPPRRMGFHGWEGRAHSGNDASRKRPRSRTTKRRIQVLNFSTFLCFWRVAFKCRVEKVKSLRKSELRSILLVTECRVESLKIALLDSKVSSRNRPRICVRRRAREKQFESRKTDAASFDLCPAALSIPAFHSPLTAPK